MKAIIEYMPLVIFFVFYKTLSMKIAIIGLMASSIVSLAISKISRIKISPLIMLGTSFVLIFGALSLIFDDDSFIKMKSSFVFSLFALITLYFFFKGGIIDSIKSSIPNLPKVPSTKQKKLALIWFLFFATCAITNEFVWRNFSSDIWINFKVFVFPIANLIITVVSIIMIKDYFVEKK